MPRPILITGLLFIVAVSPIAFGGVIGIPLIGNLNFLRDSPVAYFDKDDLALFRRTTTATLNEATDGESRTWSNAVSGNSGEISVVRTLPRTDVKCRELQITNRAAGRSHTENAVFCYDVGKNRWAMRQEIK